MRCELSGSPAGTVSRSSRSTYFGRLFFMRRTYATASSPDGEMAEWSQLRKRSRGVHSELDKRVNACLNPSVADRLAAHRRMCNGLRAHGHTVGMVAANAETDPRTPVLRVEVDAPRRCPVRGAHTRCPRREVPAARTIPHPDSVALQDSALLPRAEPRAVRPSASSDPDEKRTEWALSDIPGPGVARCRPTCGRFSIEWVRSRSACWASPCPSGPASRRQPDRQRR